MNYIENFFNIFLKIKKTKVDFSPKNKKIMFLNEI